MSPRKQCYATTWSSKGVQRCGCNKYSSDVWIGHVHLTQLFLWHIQFLNSASQPHRMHVCVSRIFKKAACQNGTQADLAAYSTLGTIR